MRDFERDVSSATAWTGSVPGGEQPWSLARKHLFDSCRRAFFLCHFLSQGGWDQYTHPLIRECYLQKRLATVAEWQDDVLNDALKTSIDATLRTPDAQRADALPRAFRFEVSRLASISGAELRNEEWRSDPKKLHLFEIHYGLDGWNAFEEGVKTLTKAAKSFSESDLLLGLLCVDRAAWRRLNEFESFRLMGIEVWSRPPLAWVENAQAKFLELSLRQSSFNAERAALYDLLAFHRFKTLSGTSRCCFATPDGNFITLNPEPRPLRALILESHAKMLSFTRPDGRVYLEDFAKTSDGQLCETCRFKGVCEKFA